MEAQPCRTDGSISPRLFILLMFLVISAFLQLGEQLDDNNLLGLFKKDICLKDAIIIDDKNVDNEYIHAVRCIEDAKEIFKW